MNTHRAGALLYAAGVCGALLFGAAQASAETQGRETVARRACDPAMCDFVCVEYEGASFGYCRVIDYNVYCVCVY